ncbi:MAG: glycosyl hydrolase [Elusimicrobiota bacterium]
MLLPKMKKLFVNPGIEYRGAPFWSWNDTMDANELVRQVNDMKSVGMGGFFMHSRDGLETEYMGKDWLYCIRSVVDEAKKVGMHAWLYDEDRWPSGFSGGLVTQNGPKFWAKGLTLTLLDTYPQSFPADTELQTILAVFIVSINGNKLSSCKRVQDIKVPQKVLKTEKVAVFKMEASQPMDWHNGYPYCDNLSRDSVKKFIETTYEAYYKEVGDAFGTAIPGIFTDEPHIHGFRPAEKNTRFVPWTIEFVSFFENQRGYDVLGVVPYLFFDGVKSRKVSHDYWHTIAELYREAFSKQIYDWCEDHKIKLTGHYLSEESLNTQVHTAGAIMPLYVYEQQPGVDILAEQFREITTVKQCTSVANQFGRKRVLSELYGCTGWEFTFEGQKWVGDWQYALGVNFRCQHLALYTLRGCAKRDYPPSFNYQNSWWKQNNVVEDYFARLSLTLSEGKAVRDILFIHPVSTAWSLYTSYAKHLITPYNDAFKNLSKMLISLHRDYDYGDEMILEEYGKVTGKTIKINNAAYKVVLLPPALTLFSNTMNLLKKFMNNGGKVIAIKPLPVLADGKSSADLKKLFKHKNMTVLPDIQALENALTQVLPRSISVTDELGIEVSDIVSHEREVEGYTVLFLANMSKDKTYTTKVRVKTRGAVEEWNLLTGEIEECNAVVNNGYLEIKPAFMPVQSRLYVIRQGGKVKNEVKPQRNETLVSYPFGPVFKHRRLDLNSLPLDFCEFKFNGSEWSQEMPVWHAQRLVREKLGLRQVAGNGGLQRWKWINEKVNIGPAEFVLKFKFKVKNIPKLPAFFVVEGAEQFEIELNGNPVSNKSSGWWCDRSFDKIELPGIIAGENVVTLKCNYKNSMQVEDCYLVGDFGIDSNTKEVVNEPGVLRYGDWCFQGYPYYGGSMEYLTELELDPKGDEKYYFTFGEAKCTTAVVNVNNNPIPLPWRSAQRVEITRFVKPGKNIVNITVYGSQRNILGPLHDARYPHYMSCGTFRSEGRAFSKDEYIFPYGLMSHTKVEVSRIK